MYRKKISIFLIFISMLACTEKKDNTAINNNNNRNTAEKIIIIKDKMTVMDRYNAPAGYKRVEYPEGSFENYLRTFPLKEYGVSVYYYNGGEKPSKVHDSVLDIDTGKQDLQQCADAVMRLRAEYLYKNKKYNEISFNFVNGFKAEYVKWAEGNRISNSGNKSSWYKKGNKDYSYENFRKYMDIVFSYANTYSLDKELKKQVIEDLKPGDVFIKPGFPGHAIIVMDVAENEQKNKVFLLAQSYMPAQDMHILKNYNNSEFSPWYSAEEITNGLETPEWNFTIDQLKQF